MKAIHVLRKPCSREAGTVAANVLRWGTGALNINASRVGYENTQNPATNPLFRKEAGYKNANASDTGSTSYSIKDGSGERNPHTGGRWPANLILQHLDGCRQDGIRQVKFSDRPGHGHERSPVSIFGSTRRHSEIRHGDDSGRETVAAYECAPGCPVAALDAQSGITKSAVALEVKTSRVKGQFVVNATSIPGVNQHGDTGGASRYFKQTHHKQD